MAESKYYVDIERSVYALHDTPSFGLLRTNPKLSTNVRIMSNGNGIWLESFNAHEALANEMYKHFFVSSDSAYNRDLAKFYEYADYALPYTVGQEYTDMSVKDKYSQQYETMYWCGCEYIDSLVYQEEMGLLAPLWIGQQLPNYFVVFRIDDPSYLNIKEWLGTHNENDIMPDMDFKKDILDKCDIVKCFDLRDGKSSLGTYLHNYINQDDFPYTPLEVSVDKEHETAYYGIDIVNGCFKRISEMQYPQYFETDQTVLEFDSFITGGFERHKMACANLLNLEFLFNDPKADEYKFSRYFGLYCNKIELGSFELNWDELRCDKYIRKGDKILLDTNGVRVPMRYNDKSLKLNGGGDGTIQDEEPLSERNCVGYADSQVGTHKLRLEDNSTVGEFHLKDKVFDLYEFAGFVQEDTSIAAKKNFDGWGCQQLYFDILDDIPAGVTLEIRRVYMQGSTEEEIMDCGTVLSDYCGGEDDPVLVPGWQDGCRFCGTNEDKSKLARMVKNAFRSLGESILEFYCYKNRVIISTKNTDGGTYKLVVGGLDSQDQCEAIFGFNSLVKREVIFNEVQETDENEIAFSHIVKDYGYSFARANWRDYVLVGNNDISVFDYTGGIYLPTNTLREFAQVTDIVQYVGNAIMNEDGVITKFDGGLMYGVLLDEDNVTVDQDSVSIYKQYIPTYGVLSYFPLKDFDTYTCEEVSLYGDMGELAIERLMYEEEEPECEEVGGNVGDDENNNSNNDNNNSETNESATSNNDTVTLKGRLIPPQDDTEVDFDVDFNVTGDVDWNFTNVDSNNNIDQSDITRPDPDDENLYKVEVKLDVRNNGGEGYDDLPVDDEFEYPSLSGDLTSDSSDTITNEYERYYENYNAQSCLVSKVVPYVGKWVMQYKGYNVREKPYRHTNNNAFGEFNFSPSVTTDNLDTRAFTQEWMYIFDKYPYANIEDWKKSWSYVGFTESNIGDNESIIDDCLLSTERDYFEMLFSCDCARRDEIGNSVETTDTLNYRDRWSIFSHGTEDFPSVTYFHGIGVELIEKSDWAQCIDNNMNNLRSVNTGNMNGYRFGAVAVPTTDDTKWTLPLQIIRNDKFKFVCVVKYIPSGFKYIKPEELPDTATSEGHVPEDDAWHDKNIAGSITRTLLYNYPAYDNAEHIDLYCVKGFGEIKITAVYNMDLDNDNPMPYDAVLYNPNGRFLRNIDDANENTIYLYKEQIRGDWWKFKVYSVPNDTTVYVKFVSDSANRTWTNNSGIGERPFSYIIANRRLSNILKIYDDCLFSNIYHIVNTEQRGNVQYKHRDADGGLHISSYDENGEWSFCIRFLPRIVNAKYNYLIPVKNIAAQSIDYNVRGYNISRMVRNNGFYEPLFRDMLYFKDALTDKYLDGTATDLQVKLLQVTRGAHIEWACNYPKFALLPILHFHRVNNNLSASTMAAAVEKRKLFPLANLIPVGTKYDTNIFNSNFDPYYYILTLNSNKERFVHGTANMLEHKSFLGGKHLRVPDEIGVECFNWRVLQKNKVVKLVNIDVVVTPTDKDITFSVSGENILRKYLHERLRPEMQKWVADVFGYGDRTTIEDDIDAYIDENLVKLYKIKEISLWEKDSQSNSEMQDYSYFGEDNRTKYFDGLRTVDNVSRKTYGSGGINMRLIYSIKKKKNYCFGLSVVFERR